MVVATRFAGIHEPHRSFLTTPRFGITGGVWHGNSNDGSKTISGKATLTTSQSFVALSGTKESSMKTKSIWPLVVTMSIILSSLAGTFAQNRPARSRRATAPTSRRSVTTTSEESKPKDDATKPASNATEAAAATPATDKTQDFVVSVKEMPAGTTRGATLTLSDNSAIVDDKEPDIRIEPVDPSVMTIESQHLRADKKALLFTVKTGPQAFGVTTFKVLKGDEKKMEEQAYVDLTITAFQQHPLPLQPTPSGIRRVDLMWVVLPDEVIKDNFGRKAAEKYYGIQVAIGNNTGFDLQIVSLAFNTNLKSPDDSNTIAKNAHADNSDGAASPIIENKSKPKFQIPVIDHKYVRGTLEKEQSFGGRARALGLITAFGTLSTGFLPFFHALGPRANFGSFTSLLNGNFKEGFGLAVPDLTVRQLNRLENQVMHDQLIIPNNTQERTVVFVPKKILSLGETVASETNRKRKPTTAEIMTSLGELTLVGRKIKYEDMEDRESVVGRNDLSNNNEKNPEPEATPVAPPISVDSVTPDSGTLSQAQEVTIKGSGFTAGADVKVKFGDRQVTGRAISASEVKATVPPVAAATNIDVEVIAGDRRDTLKDGYTYLDELKIDSFDPASVPVAGGATLKIKGKGFMSGAEVTVGGVAVENAIVSDDHNQITLTVPAHAAGMVTVVVKNPNGKSFSFANAFSYAQPAPPTPTPSPAAATPTAHTELIDNARCNDVC
jgi:hypothetical protein